MAEPEGMMRTKNKAAVFIDRDGTLNEMVYDDTHGLLDSPRKPDQVRLKRGAADFLQGVKELGYLRLIVTNQPGLAKGTLTLNGLNAVNRRLRHLLGGGAADWDGFLYCPHHPAWSRGGNRVYVRTCDCRKPAPGLLLRGADDFGVDLTKSWMVGDGLNDMEAGRRAGCRTILLARLKLEQIERFLETKEATPDFIAADLGEALRIIKTGA